MITREEKKTWLAALRSGEYTQTQKYLHLEGAYCCMGVLAKLLGVTEEQMGECGSFWNGDRGLQSSSCSVDAQLKEKLRKVLEPDQCEHLARMNDRERKSFAKIADWIEEHVNASSDSDG